MTDIYTTTNKYKIIYADPPWNYRVWSKNGEQRTASSHYSVMTIEDIYNMSDTISNISDTNSVLLMWVTYPLMQEGL